jgi:hypothetical protein
LPKGSCTKEKKQLKEMKTNTKRKKRTVQSKLSERKIKGESLAKLGYGWSFTH